MQPSDNFQGKETKWKTRSKHDASGAALMQRGGDWDCAAGRASFWDSQVPPQKIASMNCMPWFSGIQSSPEDGTRIYIYIYIYTYIFIYI